MKDPEDRGGRKTMTELIVYLGLAGVVLTALAVVTVVGGPD